MPGIGFSRRWFGILAVLGFSVAARPAAAALEYTVTDLGSGSTTGINASGQVIGVSGVTHRSYLDSGAGMVDLGTLPAPYDAASYPAALNSSGEVVGEAADSDFVVDEPVGSRAFSYQNGVMTDLGTLGGSSSFAYGINDNGDIVGYSTITGDSAIHAFIDSGGLMTDLGTLGGPSSEAMAINNSGEVVGNSSVSGSSSYHAFLFTGGVMTDIGTLYGGSSAALGVNNQGEIVGYSTTSSGPTAFFYANGSMIDLGSLDMSIGGSQANAIDDSGDVVGESSDGAKPPQAFIYSDGAMQNLNNLIDPSLGWDILDATGINDSGQIVAYGTQNRGETEALLLTPIPEPSFFGIAALGVAAVLQRARRARRSCV